VFPSATVSASLENASKIDRCNATSSLSPPLLSIFLMRLCGRVYRNTHKTNAVPRGDSRICQRFGLFQMSPKSGLRAHGIKSTHGQPQVGELARRALQHLANKQIGRRRRIPAFTSWPRQPSDRRCKLLLPPTPQLGNIGSEVTRAQKANVRDDTYSASLRFRTSKQ
jgi:hypothetical protein